MKLNVKNDDIQSYNLHIPGTFYLVFYLSSVDRGK